MVVVVAAEAVDVHGDAGSPGKAMDAVGDHLGAEIANLLTLKTEVDNGKGTVRQIDDGTAEGLVERAVCVSEAREAGGCAESLGESVTKSDADVFGGVVVVDYERDQVNSEFWMLFHEDFCAQAKMSTNCEGRPCKQAQDSSRHAWQAHGACGQGSQCRY